MVIVSARGPHGGRAHLSLRSPASSTDIREKVTGKVLMLDLALDPGSLSREITPGHSGRAFIVWSLIPIVTVKYILVIMRLDNRGEGGILALLALSSRSA